MQKTPTHVRTEIIYETPKRQPVREDDDDYYDEFLEENAKKFGRENVFFVDTLT